LGRPAFFADMLSLMTGLRCGNVGNPRKPEPANDRYEETRPRAG